MASNHRVEFCFCCCLIVVMSDSLAMLWTVAHQAPLSMGFPGKKIPWTEWVAISFSRESSRFRVQTCVFCTGRWTLYHWTTREAPSKIRGRALPSLDCPSPRFLHMREKRASTLVRPQFRRSSALMGVDPSLHPMSLGATDCCGCSAQLCLFATSSTVACQAPLSKQLLKYFIYCLIHWLNFGCAESLLWAGANLYLQCVGFSLWWVLSLQSTGTQ